MPKKDKSARKKLRAQIARKLESTFGDLKDLLGKTRFTRNIKKAAKALTTDLKDVAPEPVKKPKKSKAPAKKPKVVVPDITKIA